MKTNYFHKMIQHLRQKEEIMLYGNILNVSQEEQTEVLQFLASEYENESSGFPFSSPVFDKNAALWAAGTVYMAAQLMLYRENKSADLEKLLPRYEGEITPSAILSADLCTRFLPDILVKLKLIDTEDKLINILEEYLKTWHYSGVSYPFNCNELNFDIVVSDKCLHQLYVNRIIQNKKLQMANLPVMREKILSALGIFAEELWKDFKTTSQLYEQQH